MIIARAPFRVSLIGGGTDYPTYYKKFGGCVIGGTINQYCYVTIRKINNIFLSLLDEKNVKNESF